MHKLAFVFLVVSAAHAQKRMPGAPDANGVLTTRACDGIEVKLDLPSVKAAQAKIRGEYTADNAEYDGTKLCRGVIASLESLCKETRPPDEGAGAPPSPVVGKVKSVRCVVLDKDAPHEQDFADGVWTVRFSLWSNPNLLNDAQPGKPRGPNSIAGQLAKTLGLTFSPYYEDQLFRGFEDDAKRCTGPKDCPSGLSCGKDTRAGMLGPRCVKAGPPKCSEGGGPFGHADKACPKGHFCTQYGFCFPKNEFPVAGKRLPKHATCYLDRECASGACVGSGQDRFGTGKGTCR